MKTLQPRNTAPCVWFDKQGLGGGCQGSYRQCFTRRLGGGGGELGRRECVQCYPQSPAGVGGWEKRTAAVCSVLQTGTKGVGERMGRMCRYYPGLEDWGCVLVSHTWLVNGEDWSRVLSVTRGWTSGGKDWEIVSSVTPKASRVGEKTGGVCSAVQDWGWGWGGAGGVCSCDTESGQRGWKE